MRGNRMTKDARNSLGIDENAIVEEAVKEIDPALIARLKDDAKKKKLSILIVGKTGVGKSSTINSMMDEEVASVGDFEPVTTEVRPYFSEINGVPYSVYDTPGLCDDLEEKGMDDIYLDRIINGVPYVDCMLYVSRLDENRVSADEMRGIRLVTEAFGPDVWKRAVIVFTHADKVEKDKLDYYQQGRLKAFRKHFPDSIANNIVKSIPSVRVTNISPFNPDEEYWLSKLFTTVFDRMEVDGQRALFMLTHHRIVERSVEVDDDKEFVTSGTEEAPEKPSSSAGKGSGKKESKPIPPEPGQIIVDKIGRAHV